uniref:Uncharacterized protein n=1 Tax=Ananas comosus var. bracteatus TaxID=296719 RepID=A0A6V7QWF1_ANACO
MASSDHVLPAAFSLISCRSPLRETSSVVKAELLDDPAFDFTDESRQWIDRMLDYNVPGGKLNRGLSVIDSYKLLKAGVELQAYFLVLDDIMDNSHTRRGQLCWYRVPKADEDAADASTLIGIPLKTSHVKFVLHKECLFGQRFLLVGDDSNISSWDPSKAIPLNGLMAMCGQLSWIYQSK